MQAISKKKFQGASVSHSIRAIIDHAEYWLLMTVSHDTMAETKESKRPRRYLPIGSILSVGPSPLRKVEIGLDNSRDQDWDNDPNAGNFTALKLMICGVRNPSRVELFSGQQLRLTGGYKVCHHKTAKMCVELSHYADSTFSRDGTCIIS